MAVSTSTPPQSTIKVIFPFNVNQNLVDQAAITCGIIAYPEQNILLFEGDCNSNEYRQIRAMLKGGVIA